MELVGVGAAAALKGFNFILEGDAHPIQLCSNVAISFNEDGNIALKCGGWFGALWNGGTGSNLSSGYKWRIAFYWSPDYNGVVALEQAVLPRKIA